MAKPVTIGSKKFTSQKAALEFFDEIFKRYQIGETINNPDDHEHLLKLLETKSNAQEKIGDGVKRFYKDTNIGGTPSIWIERMNSTKDDFSLANAIKKIKAI